MESAIVSITMHFELTKEAALHWFLSFISLDIFSSHAEEVMLSINFRNDSYSFVWQHKLNWRRDLGLEKKWRMRIRVTAPTLLQTAWSF